MAVLTWRANRAKTMRQKTVSVMTSASCLTEWRSALMMVFRPATRTQSVRLFGLLLSISGVERGRQAEIQKYPVSSLGDHLA